MRYLWFSFLLLFAGCEHHDVERASLDALLSSGSVSRIEFVSTRQATTNVVVGQQVGEVLAMLSASNRVDKAVDHKSASGRVILCQDGERVVLTYFFSQQVFSFRGYQFTMRGSNEMQRFFK